MDPLPKKLKLFIYRPKPARQTIWANWLFKCEPLEVEYLYTVLKDHGDITLMDGQVKRYNLARRVRKQRPDILLLTSLITNVNTVLKLAARVKKQANPPLVFIGGPHAEVLPQHFFTPDVDGVFFSNQLVAIEKVVRAIREGKSYQEVDGACFPVNGVFRINRPEKTDLEHFPLPERPLLNKYRGKYNLFYFRDCASLKTSFGCPEKCTFCYCRKMNGEEYGRRPLESILAEIETIPNRNIFIVDDNFLLSPPRLQAFCAAIRERNIQKQFIVYGTARFIAQHPDLMKDLYEAGLRSILVGMEFISDEALTEVQKGSTYADNEECINVCHALGIELVGLFMLDPRKPASEYKKLARFVRQRKIYLATFATLTTLPGTDLWNRQGPKEPDTGNLWRYDFLRLQEAPVYMTRFRYYRWLIYLYLRLVFRPDGFRHFKKLAGVRETIRMSVSAVVSSFDFLIKIIVWP